MGKHAAKCPRCGGRLDFETAVGDHLVCAACGAKLRVPRPGEPPAEPARAAAPPPDPLVGQTLGKFEILQLLGHGGMGTVYKARQHALDRFVALKVLPDRLAADASFVERFHREARAAAAISHPNIIEVYDVGEEKGCQYIAMEFIEGESLADLLKREGRLPPDRAIELLTQVASALADAHAAGILHRDIKPANILLDRRGRAKVADFGLAKRADADVSITVTGQSLGTPLYMPPEVCEAKPSDPRSDLYSLGATFYQAIAGRPPFDGSTPAELIVKHVTGQVPPLQSFAPDAPPALCRIIHRLLRKNPAERYQSADELLQALSRVEARAGQPPAAVSASAATATMPAGAVRPSKATRRHAGAGPRARPLALIVGGSIATLILIGVLVFALTRGGRKPEAQGQAPDAPATSTVVAPEPSADASETYAFRLFERALAAAEDGKWLSVESYLRRLDKDYAGTRFVASNQAAIAGLRARLAVAQGKPPTPTPQPTPPMAEEWTALPNGWRVGKPVNLGPTVNSQSTDTQPCVSADSLTLIFASDQPGGEGVFDLWTCTRRSSTEAWGPPVNLGPTVNSSAGEGGPCLSADSLALLFHSNRPGGQGSYDIWMCTRRTVGDLWDHPVNLGSIVNSGNNDGDPTLSADGLILVFTSSGRPGRQGSEDLCMCTRRSPGDPWGSPANLGPAVNSSADDGGPSLSGDALTLFFHSRRPGGQGGCDLWMCTRRNRTEPFGEPVNLGTGVNSASNEVLPGISSDGRTLYFSSDRPGGQGGFDLWQAPLLPPGAPPDDEARWGPWEDLFDGQTLKGWRIPEGSPFDGHGRVYVEEGQIILDQGGFTAIAWSGAFPGADYEVVISARRMAGSSDFASIVFPVGDGYSRLIVGGTADRNIELDPVRSRAGGRESTTRQFTFRNGEWYRLRLRVAEERIEAWVGDEQVLKLSIAGCGFPSTGLTNALRCFAVHSSWSKAAIREVRLRRLKPALPPPDAEGWISLFDGKSLEGWKVAEAGRFGGHGKVAVEEGKLVLEPAKPETSTGIAWTGEFPRVDYEVAVRAAGPTGWPAHWIYFPLADTPLLLSVEGHGAVQLNIGLEVVEGQSRHEFVEAPRVAGQAAWHDVRLRVTSKALTVWVDEEKVWELVPADHKLMPAGAYSTLGTFGLLTHDQRVTVHSVRLRRLEARAP